MACWAGLLGRECWAEGRKGRGGFGPSARTEGGRFFPFLLFCFLFVSFFISKPFQKNKFENILTLIKVTQYKNINDPA